MSSFEPPSALSANLEAGWRLLFDGSPTGALVLDADSLCILDCNDSARRDFGLAADLDSVSLGDLFLGFPLGNALALLRRLRQGLVDHLVIETRRRTSGGMANEVEIRFSYSPSPSPRYLALVLDLSERSRPDELSTRRERLRDALAEILRAITRINDRQELYREACRIAVERGGFRMAWVGIVDQASDGIVPVASAGFEDGYLEMLQLRVHDDPRGPGMTATAIQTGQPVAIADPRTDPMFQTLRSEVERRGYESAVALPFVVEGRSIGALTVYGTVVNAFGAIEVELLQHLADDISFKLEVIGREETRRAVEADRDRLAEVVEQAGESVVVTDHRGYIVYTNPAFTKITGYEMDEVVGKRPDFLRGDQQPSETADAIRRAILEGQSWAGPSRDRRRDGTERYMHLIINPRRDEHGAVVGSIIIGRDVSRERSLEAQLIQSQKIEAIGRLAGGIAHDFNNLLTAISGYAAILKAELEPDDARVLDVAEIQRAAARATQLTSQLLAFSRRQILRPSPLDPQSVVTGVAPMLRRLLGEDVDLVVAARPGLGPIMADPSQLDQVLLNLALNARDAMPDGGRLDIETDESILDEAFVAAHVGVKPGPYVVFRVRDTGTGMTPEVLGQAFEPFFTTKGPGKGTGLGLATVLGIVEQSNGYIDAVSEPGHGATFNVYLPRAATSKPEASAPQTRSPNQQEAGTILVVEDEEPVRALLARILKKAGYAVLSAATGEQALEIEAAYEGRIDLLFTDVILPGINGRQLVEQLEIRRPGMPVLYASGYNQEIIAGRGVLQPGISYLAKPYTSDDLLERLKALLGTAVQGSGQESG